MSRNPWKHKVLVFYPHDAEFTEIRDRVVEALEGSRAVKDGERGEELAALVEELSETVDAEDYDWVIDAIYDLGDEDKWLWLEVQGRLVPIEESGA